MTIEQIPRMKFTDEEQAMLEKCHWLHFCTDPSGFDAAILKHRLNESIKRIIG